MKEMVATSISSSVLSSLTGFIECPVEWIGGRNQPLRLPIDNLDSKRGEVSF